MTTIKPATPKILILLLSFATFLASASAVFAQADPRAAAFSAEFPFESKFIEVNGHTLHYIDEGNTDGDTFLFLHGNPTSSYLWRNIMPYVKTDNRIVAVDNIGFGKSEQPSELDYTFQTHYQYIESFIEQTGLKNIVLVIHDWGSILGLNYAMENSDNVKGIVMMEALIPPAFPMPTVGFFSDFRDPETGRQLLIEENMFIEGILLNGPVTRSLSDAEKAVYRAPFLTAATRFPIYVWPNELPIGGEPARNVTLIENIGTWLGESEIPKLVQYADPGVMITAERAQWMIENYRNVETQFVGYGTHYIQEDNPQVIGRGIVEWHRRTF